MRHSEGQACECRLLYEVWIQGREEKVQALISRRQHHEPLVLPQRAVQGPGQSESGTEGRRDLSPGGPGGDKGVKGMEVLLRRCMYDLEIRVLGVLTRARARQSAEQEHRSQCLTEVQASGSSRDCLIGLSSVHMGSIGGGSYTYLSAPLDPLTSSSVPLSPVPLLAMPSWKGSSEHDIRSQRNFPPQASSSPSYLDYLCRSKSACRSATPLYQASFLSSSPTRQ